MTIRKKIGALAIISVILILTFITVGIDANNYQYFLSRRVPKIAAIVLTGGCIAFSSLIFQTITNNKILTPSILGLDSLYVAIQTFMVFVFGSTSRVMINGNVNFIISVSLMIIFSTILFNKLLNREGNNIFFLLLVGLIFGTLFSSVSSFMQMIIDPNEFLIVLDKMFASFNNVNTDILTIASISTIAILIYTFRYKEVLDVVSLGREQAINLGIEYDKFIKKMLIIIAILVSISTALVGPITFLGLLVTNISYQFLNTYKHKYLIVGSMLISIVFLVGGQLVVERVLNFNTTLSVIINFVGGIYFVYLLLKEVKEW